MPLPLQNQSKFPHRKLAPIPARSPTRRRARSRRRTALYLRGSPAFQDVEARNVPRSPRWAACFAARGQLRCGSWPRRSAAQNRPNATRWMRRCGPRPGTARSAASGLLGSSKKGSNRRWRRPAKPVGAEDRGQADPRCARRPALRRPCAGGGRATLLDPLPGEIVMDNVEVPRKKTCWGPTWRPLLAAGPFGCLNRARADDEQVHRTTARRPRRDPFTEPPSGVRRQPLLRGPVQDPEVTPAGRAAEFFPCNTEHRHGGIAMLTPDSPSQSLGAAGGPFKPPGPVIPNASAHNRIPFPKPGSTHL